MAMAATRSPCLIGALSQGISGIQKGSSRRFAAFPCSNRGDEVVDVAILGSGMVGAALAAVLGRSSLTANLRVALIDRARPSWTKDAANRLPEFPELRVSTLTPASTRLLEAAGAWDNLKPPVGASFRDMQVWDDRGPGFIRYDAAEVGRAEMGHVLENSAIQSALLAAIHEGNNGSAELMAPEEVESLELPPYKPSAGAAGNAPLASVCLKGGRNLRCRLVVGADGAASPTREAAGIRAVGWGYNQRGVVACVRTDRPNSTAWQSFLSTGPLALLPVRDGYSNIVWSTTTEVARQLEAMGPKEFAAAANAALAAGGPGGDASPRSLLGLLGAAARQAGGSQPQFVIPPQVVEYVGSPPRSFPLKLMHSGRYVRPRLALVGDAAHAVHPLGGQGVNLGFGDAEALARAIRYAVQVGADIGDARLLEAEYEEPRQRANLAMMGALDALKRIFAAQAEPLASLRSLGLELVNATPAARQQIMAYAMGSST